MSNSAPQTSFASALDRYELVGELRELDLGPVYLATDKITQASLRSLTVKVAVARIPHNQFSAPDELTTLRTNLARVKAVEHPHILRIFQLVPGEQTAEHAEDLVCLEFSQSISLADLLGRVTLSTREILAILIDTCTALEALYKLGFEPFGVSPAHILVLPDGTTRIDPLSAALTGTRDAKRFKALTAFEAPIGHSGDRERVNDTYTLGAIGKSLLLGKKLINSAAPNRQTPWVKRCNELWSKIRARFVAQQFAPQALSEALEAMSGAHGVENIPSIREAKFTLAHIQAELPAETKQLKQSFSQVFKQSTKVSDKHQKAPRYANVDEAPDTPAPKVASSARYPSLQAAAFVFLIAAYLGVLLTAFSRYAAASEPYDPEVTQSDGSSSGSVL